MCEYGMYARLAVYSRLHQDIPKRDQYIRHVHGRMKGGIDKRQKAVVAYSAWLYVRGTILPLSLSLSFVFSLLFFYFIVIIYLQVFYHSFSFLFYYRSCLTLIPRVSLILLFHTLIVPKR